MEKYFLSISFFLLLFLEITEIDGKMNLAYDIYLPSSGEKPDLSPMVFLHGFLDSKKSWRYVAQPLADKTGRKIYTYDARNHGDSPWTPDFNIDILAEDLEDFLALRNIAEVILVGHSMGGRTAQTLALRQPDRVSLLIVEDMSMADLTELPDAATGLLMKLLRKSLTVIPPDADEETAIEAVKSFFLKKVPEAYIPRRAFDASIAPVNINGGNITWQANLDVLEQSIYAGALGNNLTGTFEKEALYIYGTTSLARVDKDELIKVYFPQAQLLGFVGANHLVHHEYPEDYVREIARFITGVITPTKTC